MLDAEKGFELAALAKSGSVAKVLGTPLYVESLGFYFPYRLSHDRIHTTRENRNVKSLLWHRLCQKRHFLAGL